MCVSEISVTNTAVKFALWLEEEKCTNNDKTICYVPVKEAFPMIALFLMVKGSMLV